MQGITYRAANAQRGQAIVEYVLVTLFCVMVLLIANDNGPTISSLKNAIKDFFKAYSYAISVTPQ